MPATSMLNRDYFLIFLIVVLWGIHAPIIKLGIEEIEPFLLNFIRFFLTAMGLICIAGKINLADIKKLIPVSLLFVCGNLMFAYIALDIITSNSFVIIIQIAQPITILCAYVLFGEKFGLYTVFGILVSFIGLIIIFGAPDIVQHPIGAFLAVLAALSWSLGSLAMKNTGHIPPVKFLCYSYLLASPIALGATLYFEEDHLNVIKTADSIILSFVVFYQVVIMGFMTFVWAGLMARNQAQLVTPFLMAQPIFAVIASYYLLGETLNKNIILGGTIIMIGIAVINFRKIVNVIK